MPNEGWWQVMINPGDCDRLRAEKLTAPSKGNFLPDVCVIPKLTR